MQNKAGTGSDKHWADKSNAESQALATFIVKRGKINFVIYHCMYMACGLSMQLCP